jgi:hypothetical protein
MSSGLGRSSRPEFASTNCCGPVKSVIMSDQTEQKTKIPLNTFLIDFRSSMSDKDLRAKYGLSARSFVNLIKVLLARDLVSASDLATRKQMGVQRDLAKETEFLSGLYICPQCSHPHPKPFERCPACGAQPHECLTDHDVAGPSTSSTGEFYIDESEPYAEYEAAPDIPPTEPLISIQGPRLDSSADAPATAGKQKKKKKDADEKTSPLNSVRSFLSKLTKK